MPVCLQKFVCSNQSQGKYNQEGRR